MPSLMRGRLLADGSPAADSAPSETEAALHAAAPRKALLEIFIVKRVVNQLLTYRYKK